MMIMMMMMKKFYNLMTCVVALQGLGFVLSTQLLVEDCLWSVDDLYYIGGCGGFGDYGDNGDNGDYSNFDEYDDYDYIDNDNDNNDGKYAGKKDTSIKA